MLLSTGVRWLLQPIVYEYLPFATYFSAIALTAYLAGPGPSAVTALLGFVIGLWFFVLPYFPVDLSDVTTMARIAIYFITATTLNLMGWAMHRAQHGLERELTRSHAQQRTVEDSEARLRLALRAGHMGTWEWDTRIGSVRWSPELEDIHGLAPGAFGGTIEDVQADLHPDDRVPALKTMQQAVAERRGHELVYRIVRPDGAVRWVEDRGWLLCGPDGAPERMVGICADVTERRQAEEVQQHLAAVVTSSEDAIFSKTLEGVITSWNYGAEQLYGYRAEEMIGRSIIVTIPDERREEFAWILEELRAGRPIKRHDTIRRRKDGALRHVSLAISPLRNAAGRVTGASAIGRDMTQEKLSRQALEASLREKEVLLKEIHHRVKNNLQIVSSLLSLQGDSLNDPRMLAVLSESQNRIRSMALVHEHLYRAQDLAKIPIRSYLERLTKELQRSYTLSAGIQVAVLGDEMPIGIDMAIPCGLIVNELVANALEHAFTGRQEGAVQVRLARGSGHRLILTVRDDGVGLPTGLTVAAADTLGLRLVQALANQLEATIEVSRAGGTTVTISFPETITLQPPKHDGERAGPPAVGRASRAGLTRQRVVGHRVSDTCSRSGV